MSKQDKPSTGKRKSLPQLLVPLCGILFFVWLMILGEFVIIAGWIVEIPDPVGLGPISQFLVAVGKVGLSGFLGVGWLYIWNKLVRFYFQWALKNNHDLK
ncbi:MAG: hypothetical protein ACXACA_08270 [Candidatus Ranarchaeia archaeon]|jgi:hypothetical protein